jgi:cytosine/adenosine deaminase-related metal-dependent hydrolase
MPVYIASCLLPVSQPPIIGGAVAVADGRITAVGDLQDVLEEVGDDPEVRDLGDAVILPGLVNAHTHVELSWMADKLPTGNYVDWLVEFLKRRGDEDASEAKAAAAVQIERLKARGTVAVGDISNHGWTAPMFAGAGLHAVVFIEVIGPRPEQAGQTIEAAVSRMDELSAHEAMQGAGERVTMVPSPHAPHTVSAPLLRGLAGSAEAAGQPLSIHVAESPEETAALADGSGRLADVMRERGAWGEDWTAPGDTPVAYLDRLRVLSERTIVVHAVQVGSRDQKILQSRGVSVVTCPRSNRRLGVGDAPVHALLRSGICVALGTDSLASSPDLDIFGEMQALCEQVPALSGPAVVRMATLNGARALGLHDRLGSLEAGKLDEMIVVPLPDKNADPYEVLCSTPPVVHRLDQAPWKPGPT